VTVVPDAIIRSSGAKARLPSDCAPDGIVTEDAELPAPGAGADGDGAAGDDEDELPHATEIARAVETTARRINNIRTSVLTTRVVRQRFTAINDFRNAKALINLRKLLVSRNPILNSRPSIRAGRRRCSRLVRSQRLDTAEAHVDAELKERVLIAVGQMIGKGDDGWIFLCGK
jgi:hypothetical protein